LLKTLGAQEGSATFNGGLRAVRSLLEAWGVPPSDMVLADGSGLSRYNLITPAALVTILTHVDRDTRLQGAFLASLPVAGIAGSTLSDRLQGTAAAGLVQAKTGSMTNVRSISGYLRTREGEPIVFSIVANNYGIPSADVDRSADAILLKVAELTR
jgi:serine-type D-Ala-D-Ala carboxypeptidase/endopeptidase (penicillin-binding protein 4)